MVDLWQRKSNEALHLHVMRVGVRVGPPILLINFRYLFTLSHIPYANKANEFLYLNNLFNLIILKTFVMLSVISGGG